MWLTISTSTSVRDSREESESMENKLIYDVGVCDGSDTAYYLHLGFNVVGIEASPVMVDDLRRRFAGNIADGTLTILNVGVADSEGELEFWICDDNPHWSSFDQVLAARNGARHHPALVETRRFSDILCEHGVPLYCKIDIEGKDRTCEVFALWQHLHDVDARHGRGGLRDWYDIHATQ
jgi:FkbM family methyltransferase